MFVWDAAYTTGLESIDEQHQLLIDQINRLEEFLAIPNPTPAEILFAGSVFQFLQAYAEMHFQYEENCMHRYRCPAFAENQAAHANFRQFLAEFEQRTERHGFDRSALAALHTTAREWITSHILRIDSQLKPCTGH